MKFSDIKLGEYYRIEWTHEHKPFHLIIKNTGGIGGQKEISSYINKSGDFTARGTCCSAENTEFNFLPATYEEITWLNACIESNKSLPQPKLIIYEIF